MARRTGDSSPAGRSWHWPKITRDTFLLGVGTVTFIHEAFIRDGRLAERFYIIAASLTLMGLAPILRADERRRASGKDHDDGS